MVMTAGSCKDVRHVVFGLQGTVSALFQVCFSGLCSMLLGDMEGIGIRCRTHLCNALLAQVDHVAVLHSGGHQPCLSCSAFPCTGITCCVTWQEGHSTHSK